MKPAAQWFLILFIYFDFWLLLLLLMSTQTLAAAKAKGAGRQRPKTKTVLTVQICRNKCKYSGEGTESLFWYQYKVVGALCLNLFVTFQKQLLLWMLTTPSPGARMLTISLTQTHILPASPLSIPFRCTDIVASSRSWAVDSNPVAASFFFCRRQPHKVRMIRLCLRFRRWMGHGEIFLIKCTFLGVNMFWLYVSSPPGWREAF